MSQRQRAQQFIACFGSDFVVNFMPGPELTIKPMQSLDLAAVYSIEAECYSNPWSRKQFLQELNNPAAFVDLGWSGSRLAGYICYWLIAGEMQVLNLATAPEFQRQGIAGQLLTAAIAKCQQQGLLSVWLEVRAGNQAAISLYLRYGFTADRVRKNYYRDGEDALIMCCDYTKRDS